MLRILAMVEETRALGAIKWVYKHDPEPGVRDVANWAGQVIWQASQRGHSTQGAIEELFDRKFSPEREAQFIRTLAFAPVDPKKKAARAYASDQAYQRELRDIFKTGDVDAVDGLLGDGSESGEDA